MRVDFGTLILFSVAWGSAFAESEIRDIVATEDRTCVLFADQVKCIGADRYGEGEDIQGFHEASQIKGGYRHTCALDVDGLWCWGDNSDGQTDVPGELEHITRFETGEDFTCAIDRRFGLRCWGNLTDLKHLPTEFFPDEIATGYSHLCATKDGEVHCWGRENSLLIQPPPDLVNVTGLHAFDRQTCAIAEGTFVCWGYDRVVIPRVEFEHLKDVSVGDQHMCIISEHGLECWGDNEHGQAAVPSHFVKGVLGVSAGKQHTCAYRADDVQCWGRNDSMEADPPALVVSASDVKVGRDHNCVLDEGKLNCWGNNSFGQATVPPDLGEIQNYFVSWGTTCAEDQSGLICWGKNSSGEHAIPKLKKVTGVAASYFGICIAVAGDLKCFNDSGAPSDLDGIRKIVSNTSNSSCALLDEGYQCWGHLEGKVQVKDIRDLGVMDNWICALTASTVLCEGEIPEGLETFPKPLVNPKSISLGKGYICVLDEVELGSHELVCETTSFSGLGDFPNLVNPRVVAGGKRHLCAIDNRGFNCWGRGDLGEANLPKPWP